MKLSCRSVQKLTTVTEKMSRKEFLLGFSFLELMPQKYSPAPSETPSCGEVMCGAAPVTIASHIPNMNASAIMSATSRTRILLLEVHDLPLLHIIQ